MGHKAVFTVIRESYYDEFTFARVETEVADKKLADEGLFLKALETGLTKWALETDEGWEVWGRSSEDFNVGDLSCQLSDPVLEKYLRNEGILKLEIEVSSENSQCQDWVYDTILMDRGKLDEKAVKEK